MISSISPRSSASSAASQSPVLRYADVRTHDEVLKEGNSNSER